MWLVICSVVSGGEHDRPHEMHSPRTASTGPPPKFSHYSLKVEDWYETFQEDDEEQLCE